MRAVVASPDGLHITEVPEPVMGPGMVLIQVVAAGVNRADVVQAAGSYPPPPGESDVLGLEVSGTVISVAPDVSDWVVGDKVCALLGSGGYAERVAVPATQVLPAPRGMELSDAAGLPEAICTVWSNVFVEARLQQGQFVLIHGGSSGIGTTAIQMAKAFGARVAVTAGSEAKLQACAALGADILINYREQDFAAVALEGGGVDVVLDVVGAAYLERNVQALALDGRIANIGFLGGSRAELDLGMLMAKRGSITSTGLRARSREQKATLVQEVRERVWPLVDVGVIRPIVSAKFRIDQVSEAHARLDAPTNVGKVLITF